MERETEGLGFSTELRIAEGNEYVPLESGSVVQSSSYGKYRISLKFLDFILKIYEHFAFDSIIFININLIFYLYFLNIKSIKL